MLKRIKIGDLIKQKKAHSQTGPFGTQLKASDYVEEGIPVINVRNIGFGEIRENQLEYLDEDMAKILKSHKLLKNDIVFGRKGAVERHSLISSNEEGWIQGSDCIRLRFLNNEYNPTFISYFFRTEQHKQWMTNLGSFGATMGSLNQDIISKIEIPDLSLAIQNKIASILSNYDELIENNKQRIKLLEEMAEEIYKEWFVRLRFPGYENTKIVDGLPEGWEKEPINKLASLDKGPSLNYEIPEEEGIPVINQSCVRNGVLELQRILFTENIAKNKSHCYLQENDILINSMGDGTLGRVSRNINLPPDKYIIHNCITFLRSKENYSQYLLYYAVSQNQTYFISIAQGSTGQSTLKKSLIGEIKVFFPEEKILKNFNTIVSTMWSEIGILLNKNQVLQETRDLLLPRLISGKLSVTHLVQGEELLMAAEPKEEYIKSK